MVKNWLTFGLTFTLKSAKNEVKEKISRLNK